MPGKSAPFDSRERELQAALEQRAFLFDSPDDYRAGIRDTLELLEQNGGPPVMRASSADHDPARRRGG